jgi:Fic-DOC domain mobile mystery protein B
MNYKPDYSLGATPLDPDELNGLIPDFIELQSELNILEQENILNGKSWATKYKKEILDEFFVRQLHKKMYGDVWKWAGTYRLTAKTIGIDSAQISMQVLNLMKDTQAWIEHQSYDWPELLTRFHHRLVFIHPFPNGNGRYSRLHTELLAEKYNQKIPTWGSKKNTGTLFKNSPVRSEYIASLKSADQKNIQPLMHFLYS